MIVMITEQFASDPSDHEQSLTIIWKPGLIETTSAAIVTIPVIIWKS